MHEPYQEESPYFLVSNHACIHAYDLDMKYWFYLKSSKIDKKGSMDIYKVGNVALSAFFHN